MPQSNIDLEIQLREFAEQSLWEPVDKILKNKFAERFDCNPELIIHESYEKALLHCGQTPSNAIHYFLDSGDTYFINNGFSIGIMLNMPGVWNGKTPYL